ncbi:MAG TPA: c-type cytochrome, partial [Solimonas sp.]|nr:c-type cytochrome [Solimonas sp.]
DGSVPDGLLATTPYASTGFVLVTRDRAVPALDALPDGSVVGVTYMTAPNLYFSAHPHLSAHVYTSDLASVQALEQGHIQAAMLWRPFVAGQLADAAGKRLRYTPLDEPHARWNLVALYRPESRDLARQFAQGVIALRASGQLQKLVQPYADAAASPVPVNAHRDTPPRGRLIRTSGTAVADAPPALFTLAQADTGEKLFRTNCAVCHGPKLEGRAGPALKGPIFASPAANFHVGDIFKIVAENMPAPAPGSLPHDDYVNIMAFILQQNGYPAGAAALTFDDAMKSKVPLIYREVPVS